MILSVILQAVGELDAMLKVINSISLIAGAGYIISVERRLSRIEGRLEKATCHYSSGPEQENNQ